MKIKVLVLGVLGGVIMMSSAIQAQGDDALFEKVFGTAPPKLTQTLPANIFLDGYYVGDLQIRFNPYSHDIDFPGNELIRIFEEHLRQEKVDGLQNLINSNDEINSLDLKAQRFKIDFVQIKEQVYFYSPKEFRKKVDIELSTSYIEKRGNEGVGAIKSSSLSGYLNVNSNTSVTNYKDLTDDTRSHVMDFDAVVNIDGHVFRSDFNFNNDRDDQWSFETLTMIRDDFKSKTRYYLGSQSPLVQQSQASERLFGFGFSRKWQHFGYRLPSEEFSKTIELEEVATISVKVDDKIVYYAKQDIGTFVIKNPPMNVGPNTITIQKEVDKNVTVLVEEVFINEQLNIRKGESEYAAALGYQMDGGLDNINWSDSSLYASYSWGLENHVNVALFSQMQVKSGLVGVSWQAVSNVGILTAGISRSMHDDFGVGHMAWASLIGYRVNDRFLVDAYRRYGLLINYKDPKFSATGSEQFNGNAWSINPTVYFEWFGGFSTSHRLSLNQNRDPSDFYVSTQHGVSISNRDWRYSLSATLGENASGDNLDSINFVATWTPRGTGHRVTVRKNNFSDDTDLTWHYSPAERGRSSIINRLGFEDEDDFVLNSSIQIGKTSHSVNFGKDDGRSFHGFSSRSYGQRGRVTVSYNRNADHSESINVNAGTAIVFADGIFAISKPIHDSFAIIYPKKSIATSHIKFSRDSQIDWMGPAVVSNMTSYQSTEVRLEEANTPIGTDLGNGYYRFYPEFASGTAIEIGSEGTLMVVGKLVFENGESAGLLAGRLINLANPEYEYETVFSNRTGKFAAIGIETGRYRVEWFDKSVESLEFEVTDKQNEIIDLGHITVKRK